MTDGVTEIQNAALPGFAFVGCNYSRFEADRLGNDVLEHGRVPSEDLVLVILEMAEQFRITNDAAFQRFVETGAELAVGQSRQHSGVDQYGARMVKSSK